MTDERRQALSRYLGRDLAAQAEIVPLGDGLINDTYLVRPPAGAEPAVLQRVNPIFGVDVHKDIEAVTRHLQASGMPTPLLSRTLAGDLAVELASNGVYRLMSFVPGRSTSVVSPALCREAGRLVGRFHRALAGLRHEFHFSRPGAHDLHAHLRALRDAAARATAPPAGFRELAEEVLRRAADLPEQVPGPLRLCHGDLKISNLRFDEEGRGVCLLDLDTLSYLPLGIEMGDALRSWCNPSPAGEDDPDAGFDLDLFGLAIEGYADSARELLTPAERDGLVAGVERIALELAARFLADVINDRYFRFNQARFPSRAAHNLVRGAGQLSVARGVARRRAEAEAIVARLFAADE